MTNNPKYDSLRYGYVEKLGTDQEFISSDIEEIIARDKTQKAEINLILYFLIY